MNEEYQVYLQNKRSELIQGTLLIALIFAAGYLFGAVYGL